MLKKKGENAIGKKPFDFEKGRGEGRNENPRKKEKKGGNQKKERKEMDLQGNLKKSKNDFFFSIQEVISFLPRASGAAQVEAALR